MSAVSERDTMLAQGRRLEYFTVGWNSIEGIIAILAGFFAGSIALVGFGFDSAIEVTSGLALVWRLRQRLNAEHAEVIDRRTLSFVGFTFLALAVYVGGTGIQTLFKREPPNPSYTGIALAGVSLVVMPLLARKKRMLASHISSRALHADSRQTDICAYLSAILLAGLALNALFGWWWADPVAGLAMIPLISKEGIDALRGKTCCDKPCR